MKKVFNLFVITCIVAGMAALNGCKEKEEIPVVTTAATTAITTTTATTGGEVTSDGGAEVTARGVCWGTSTGPDITGSHTSDGTGVGVFTSNLTGLTPGTTYYVRAYATNSEGTAYGNEVTFSTTPIAGATVTTTAVTGQTTTSAMSGGNVTADGGAPVTAKGVCWGPNANPDITGSHTTDGTGLGAFTSEITGLNPGQTYHVRAYATNSSGTTYGSDVTFTTLAAKPAVVTGTVSERTGVSAIVGGNVTGDGGAEILERGICWSLSPGPDIDDNNVAAATAGTGTFTCEITGLDVYTTYYARAYARNSAGIEYGADVMFTTLLVDFDGNVYTAVTIGDQVWMLENLAVTHYNDGTEIPNVTTPGAWTALTDGAFCWYNNDMATNKPLYGAMYNWFAVNSGNLCPAGWHVPTDEDFQILEIELGMTEADADLFGWRGTDQGAQLKSTSGWSYNGNGTNTSGFTAVPGGVRYYEDGGFFGAGELAYFWSSEEANAERSYYRRVRSRTLVGSDYVTEERVDRERAVKTAGKSVRCIKD